MHRAFCGWRAPIGYHLPNLWHMGYYYLCPPGASVHVTRTSMPEEGSVTLESMTQVAGAERFEQLAADLATVRPQLLPGCALPGASAAAQSGMRSCAALSATAAAALPRRPPLPWSPRSGRWDYTESHLPPRTSIPSTTRLSNTWRFGP
jgi:hypothetical protein